MNVTNIRALAARLRSDSADEHFRMDLWFDGVPDDKRPISQQLHNCGTTACIAGHAAAMAEPRTTSIEMKQRSYQNPHGQYFEAGQRFLDLDTDTARQLFLPNEDDHPYDDLDRFVAADVLDHLAETGEVEWP